MIAVVTILLVALLQPPTPEIVDTPSVKALTGLTVPEFEAEMQRMSEALGASCGTCHARGNFASDTNPRKAIARRMIEMTKAINQQYFPDYAPDAGASRLGRITCFTCHQGDLHPRGR
jgi:photosynthetic reaction center cytochrome c subunit